MINIDNLFKVGFHYGHKVRKTSTKMKPYLYGEKNGISIINICKTVLLFNEIKQVIFNIIKKNGKILFVGTKLQAKELICSSANEVGAFFINNRWIGGTITNNLYTIDNLIKSLNKKELDETSGYIENFSKKEIIKFNKEKLKLLYFASGIRNMTSNPDLLIIVDAKKELLAIQEANKKNIPIIALTDSDMNFPEYVDYIIPGNDDGVESIKFFLNVCVEFIKEAQLEKDK